MAWHYTFTYASGSTVTLPDTYPLRAGDVLRLTIVHGSEQTIDYIGGVDFTFTAPSTVTVSSLPLSAGDSIHVFNLSRNQGTGNDVDGIVSLDDIYDHMGLTSPTTAQGVLIESLRRAAQNAIRREIGCNVTQGTYTHYLPRSGSSALGPLIRTPEWPLRTIASIYVNPWGYAGTHSQSFPSTSLLTAGQHYYMENGPENFSMFGHIYRIVGEWPATPGSIKVTYVAGWTADELAGDVDDPSRDASLIRAAVMDTVTANYHATLLAREGKGYAGIKSESLEGWSESFGDKHVSIAGLSDATKESISRFRRRSFV